MTHKYLKTRLKLSGAYKYLVNFYFNKIKIKAGKNNFLVVLGNLGSEE